MTTIGKYRHLSQCSTAAGHFVILAIDHRGNLQAEMNRHAAQPISDAQFTAFKQMIIGAMSPDASAVLADPAYGIGPAIASRVLSGRVGLLAPAEVTNYEQHPGERVVQFIPEWSVEKIKRVGANGVKLLLPFHPDSPRTSERLAVVQHLVEECARHDLPFFLEPVTYSPDPQSPLGNTELRQVVVGMARQFSAMGVDVLKLQFPVDARQSDDEAEWEAACREVSAACTVPWALLSGGVDYETFVRQAQIACEAGASGVIVGRAVWAEAVTLQGDERAVFVSTTAITRLRALAEICARYATPWPARTVAPAAPLDWYERM